MGMLAESMEFSAMTVVNANPDGVGEYRIGAGAITDDGAGEAINTGNRAFFVCLSFMYFAHFRLGASEAAGLGGRLMAGFCALAAGSSLAEVEGGDAWEDGVGSFVHISTDGKSQSRSVK